MSGLRNRVRILTPQERQLILKRSKTETKSSLAQEYGVSMRTIFRIVKKSELSLGKQKFEPVFCPPKQSVRKDNLLKKKVNDEENCKKILDEKLHDWYNQEISLGKKVTGLDMMNKAKNLAKKIDGLDNLVITKMWVKNFKRRFKIYFKDPVDVSTSSTSSRTKKEEENSCLNSFRNFIQDQNYDLNNIYNVDESVFYWKILPDEINKVKDFVTVVFCANASGMHKIPLLLIGKSKEIDFRENKLLQNVPFHYIGNINPRFEETIFEKWFLNIFIPEVIKVREKTSVFQKTILFIDRVRLSRLRIDEINSVDETIQVMFLPSSTFGAMNQGVIHYTKQIYKRYFIRQLLEMLEKGLEHVRNKLEKFNIKDCCYMISHVWNLITYYDIQRIWNKILKYSNDNFNWKEPDDKTLTELCQLLHKLPGFENCTERQVKNWVEADFYEEKLKDRNTSEMDESIDWFSYNKNYLSEDENYENMDYGPSNDYDEYYSEEEISNDFQTTSNVKSEKDVELLETETMFENSMLEEEENIPTDQEAYNALLTFMKWYEHRKNNKDDIIMLQKFKNKVFSSF